MNLEQIVSRDPEVMNGALVFSGTRVPVTILVQHLTAGDSLEIFLEDFPTVSREQAVAYLELQRKRSSRRPFQGPVAPARGKLASEMVIEDRR